MTPEDKKECEKAALALVNLGLEMLRAVREGESPERTGHGCDLYTLCDHASQQIQTLWCYAEPTEPTVSDEWLFGPAALEALEPTGEKR